MKFGFPQSLYSQKQIAFNNYLFKLIKCKLKLKSNINVTSIIGIKSNIFIMAVIDMKQKMYIDE